MKPRTTKFCKTQEHDCPVGLELKIQGTKNMIPSSKYSMRMEANLLKR